MVDVMVKERPILFSGPMVRAILDDRKTQTRRVVKHQTGLWRFVDLKDSLGYIASELWRWAGFLLGPDSHSPGYFKCPYGKPGDRLWVRETWSKDEFDNPDSETIYREDMPGWDGPWRPSIHMRRKDSRINLEIVSIRVERVQDCDNPHDSVLKEGWSFDGINTGIPYKDFAILWDSINAKRGYAWADNPYVWVVEFKRLEVEGEN